MGIAVRADQGGDADMLATDLARHVAEDREGGYHLQIRLGGNGRSGDQKGAKDRSEERAGAVHGRVSFLDIKLRDGARQAGG